MKTLNELYEELLASDGLKAEFAEAAKQPDTLVAFAKANGVETTADEIATFIKVQREKTGELDDEELDMVAGGGCSEITWDIVDSLFLYACVMEALDTAFSDDKEWGKDDAICG